MPNITTNHAITYTNRKHMSVTFLWKNLNMGHSILEDCRTPGPLNILLEKLLPESLKSSLLAEVSHDEAKMSERRETSAGFQHVFYHACACVSLTTSDVFVTCDTTHRTGLHAKLQEMSRNPQARKFEVSEDVR